MYNYAKFQFGTKFNKIDIALTKNYYYKNNLIPLEKAKILKKNGIIVEIKQHVTILEKNENNFIHYANATSSPIIKVNNFYGKKLIVENFKCIESEYIHYLNYPIQVK
jgi:hypothetical protein